MSTRRTEAGAPSINQGIQAESVTAEVLAVGRGARAFKNVAVSGTPSAELVAAIQNLRAELEKTANDRKKSIVVDGEIAALERETKRARVNPQRTGGLLKRIVKKLREAGALTSETAKLGESIRKIATLVGIPLKLLGLV